MTSTLTPQLHPAHSIDEALDLLNAFGGDAEPLAGATWIMRAPLRRVPFRPAYVGIASIESLRRIEAAPDALRIGAAVTHHELASWLETRVSDDDWRALNGLRDAAAKSANPSVRAAATVGGNLGSRGFMAADLVPALIGLNADVVVASPEGAVSMPVEAFVRDGASLPAGHLMTEVVIPAAWVAAGTYSAHARLPLRKAGDYPVAIVSASLRIDTRGRIAAASIAVGAVEARPRRWPSLETALLGEELDADTAKAAARGCVGEFEGRDGVEAPGWYRLQVLPALVSRAVSAIQTRIGR